MMPSETSAARRERLELASDAALITAATLAALTSIVLLISAGVGDREVPVAIQIASALAALLGGVAGPVVAWLMHHRRVSLAAVFGALIGMPVAGAVFWVFVGLSAILGWVISPISDAEYAGPLAAAAIVAAAFAALVVWLVIDAVRDYAPNRRDHRTLDVVRLVSTVIVAAYSTVIVVLAFGGTGGEIIEAIAFMLMGALGGASMVTMADVVTRLTADQAGPGPRGACVAGRKTDRRFLVSGNRVSRPFRFT